MSVCFRCLRAALLAGLLALWPFCALAAEEAQPAPEPLTQSVTVRTEQGVVVTGTRAMVDFEVAQYVNPDCVGWLYQEDTLLSQAVMQCEEDWYYDRGFDEIRLDDHEGSVWMDESLSMAHPYVVLKANGRRGGCFYTLNGYSDQAYLDAHPSLRLLTPDTGDWHADVFAFLQTTQRDDTSWQPPHTREEFDLWLANVMAQSPLAPDPSAVPVCGDRILMLAAENANNVRNVVLARLSPITYDTQDTRDLNKVLLDRRATLTAQVEVGPLGTMWYYAQNDPIWDRMRYESAPNPTFRVFGGGGCGPTAAAIAIANLVPAEELPRLAEHTLDPMGTLFDEESVNRVYTSHLHPPYRLQTAWEYHRYLPVALADFATGNNEWEQVSRRVKATGSGVLFMDLVCDIFDIERTDVGDLSQALTFMKDKTGQGVILCYALRKSPYTNSSHYVVLVGVDEEYFYVLDPWYRTDYTTTDKRKILELLTPGVTRIKLSKSSLADLSPVYYMERKAD